VKPFCLPPEPIKEPVEKKEVEVSSAVSSSKTTSVRLKYETCKNFKEKGSCKYGDRCLFAHGDHELMKNHIAEKAQEQK